MYKVDSIVLIKSVVAVVAVVGVVSQFKTLSLFLGNRKTSKV